MAEEAMMYENRNYLGEFFKSIISGQFLRKLLEWIREVIETADLSIVLLILVVLPLIVPVVPSWVTYQNLKTQMGFDEWVAIFGGITIELLGYAGALLTMQAFTDFIKHKDKSKLWMLVINALAYIFYLASVVSINVILDIKADKPIQYVLVIGLLCLMSVPSGMLSAVRIIKRDDEAEDKVTELQTQTREDKLRHEQWEADERKRQADIAFELEKMRIRADARVRRQAQQAPVQQQVQAEQYPSDWRVASAQFEFPKDFVYFASMDSKLELVEANKRNTTDRNMRNWKKRSLTVLFKFMEDEIQSNKRFFTQDEILGSGIPVNFFAQFVVNNADVLINAGYLTQDDIDSARQNL